MRIIGKIAVATAVAGGMMLAAPAANADVHIGVGNVAGVSMNGAINAELFDSPIISLNNPLNSLLPNGVLGG